MHITVLACVLTLLPAPQETRLKDESLTNQLRSSKTEDRERAERSLKLRDGKEVIAALEKAARDPDAEVAARARSILEALPYLRALTPNLMVSFPAAREMLARNLQHAWTEVFLDAAEQTGTKRKYPGIVREDLQPLASLALRAAQPAERIRVCAILAAWRLTAAVPELKPLLDDPDWTVRAAPFETIDCCRAYSRSPILLQRLRA